MITDPRGGNPKPKTTICIKGHHYSSARKGENRRIKDGKSGIRIVMNVLDMKKLMESNHDH